MKKLYFVCQYSLKKGTRGENILKPEQVIPYIQGSKASLKFVFLPGKKHCVQDEKM